MGRLWGQLPVGREVRRRRSYESSLASIMGSHFTHSLMVAHLFKTFRFSKQFLDAHEIDVRDGKIEDFLEIETTTTEQPTTTVTMEPTTVPPVVILVDDQPAAPPANVTLPPKKGRKGRRGRKRLPRSPRRGRPTRKRFRSRSR